MTTPPLLRKMLEVPVGELVVRRDQIVEPLSGCRVASGFPNQEAAIAAAREMNEVADWVGILKTRAEDRRPNCQDELKAIAERHGGSLSENGHGGAIELCARAVQGR